MPLSEADTRTKLIDPAIHACGWSEDMICRETTLGGVEIIGGKARRRSGGRTAELLDLIEYNGVKDTECILQIVGMGPANNPPAPAANVSERTTL